MYEAIDYTPSRLPRGTTSVNVRQFMAHHEGMSLLALAYLLLDRPMQRRFEADPMLRAADLLLQERVPKAVAPIFPHVAEAGATRSASAEEEGTMRVFTDPSGPVPEVHLLSNGRYHVVVTSAGGGYSRWRDLAVTRWREDATRDCLGTFCYLRDLDSGALWSTAWQPTLKPAKRYEAIFTQAAPSSAAATTGSTRTRKSASRPRTTSSCGGSRSPTDPSSPRTIEVTSYAEVVLALPGQDLAHPAFSNLFVQTELVPRPAGDPLHAPAAVGRGEAAVDDAPDDRPGHDGRRGVVRNRPDEIHRPRPNPGRSRWPWTGRRRSPTARARCSIPWSASATSSVLQPKETVRIDLVTGVAETREAVMALMEKYSDPRLADRVFELAWTHSQILLRQLNATEADAQVYGRLAGSMIYASALRRAKASVLIRNRRGQSGLWGYGISGDLPIVLVRIRDHARIELVRQAVQAHAYWRMKGLARRSGHLERGRLGLPPDAAGRDHGPRRRQPGSGAGGQARRHLRPPRRADVGRGSGAAADGGARGPGGRRRHAAEQVERRGRAELSIPASQADAAPRSSRPRPPRCRSATWRSSTAWAASAATGASTSCSSAPARPRPRRGST